MIPASRKDQPLRDAGADPYRPWPGGRDEPSSAPIKCRTGQFRCGGCWLVVELAQALGDRRVELNVAIGFPILRRHRHNDVRINAVVLHTPAVAAVPTGVARLSH